MDTAQAKIVRLESTIHALEELLAVSETSFMEESKQLEESIKKHEQLENDIRQILDASGDAIRVVSNDFRLVYANTAYLELKNLHEDIVGKICHEVIRGKDCFTENCPITLGAKGEVCYCKEEYIDTGKEVPVPYHITVAPHTDSAGNVVGVIKTFRNVTEEKAAQKTAEENAQQRGRIEMSNNMLHDIGNAMTGISAYILRPQVEKEWIEIKSLHQLRDLFITQEQELTSALGKGKQQALNHFVNALISSLEKRNKDHITSFAKIAASVGHVCAVLDLQRHYMGEKSSPLATEINLATIINDTLVMLSGSLQKRNIKALVNIHDKNLTVSGDKTRLIRVFLNIIKNIYEAFDETEDTGSRKLDINIMSDKTKKEIIVSFLDNAVGFDPETGRNLFKRGFTTKANGSGIGLHECSSIIESHGGKMTMESSGKNTGAQTTITFPFSAKSKEQTL